MGIRDLTTTGRVGVAPQRWARRAALACVLCVLPSILWRVAMLGGVDTGFADADWYRAEGSRVAYVLGLDALQLAGAVLCLGLVLPWGERVPSFVPGLGGRTIHRLVPMALGGTGAVVLYLIVGQLVGAFGSVWLGLREGWTPAAGMEPLEATVLGVAYAPLFCWPLVLTVALVGYWRRRSPLRPAGPTGRAQECGASAGG